MLRWLFNSWLRHKWYVFVIGTRIGVPLWQLLIHDLSKLHPAECRSYMRSWYGLEKLRKSAHDHHVAHNKHHWQGWIGMAMPEDYAAEMIADWMARCAIKGHMDIEEHLKEIGHNLHWLTKKRLRTILERVRRIKWR